MKYILKAISHTTAWMVLTVAFTIAACGGGGGPAGGDPANNNTGNNNQNALMDQVNRLFPFSEIDPIDVVYACQRVNSRLNYYFDLNPDGTFRTYSTTDVGDDFFFDGTYQYANNEIRLLSSSNILPLDETSDSITPQMGLIYRFTTPNMVCVAYGHGHDDVDNDPAASYLCPEYSEGPASRQENAFEFVHQAFPYNLEVPGSAFRQRDRHVQFNSQPLVVRGYGIYRRAGDNFYIYFANQFDDYQIVTGSFISNGRQMMVDQLPSGSNQCNMR